MTVASTPHASTIEPESTTAPVRSRGCGPADRAFPTVLTGEEILVTFDKPLSGRAINQYWITLVPEYAPEPETSGRTFLDRGSTTVRLRATVPGDYEVRLHGEYPKNEHHLLARTPVKVQGWPVKVADAAQPTDEQTGKECLDRWLAGENLDPYGNPTGTAYAGGTPLFDETTGRAHTRWEYFSSKHSELRRACPLRTKNAP